MTKKQFSINRKFAIIGLIITNIIWGAAAPIFKWSLLNIHLYSFLFLRNLIPGIILAIVFRKHLRISAKSFVSLFFLAFFGVTLNFYFEFVGLIHTASINSPIITSSSPIFLTMGALLFFNERPSKKNLLGNLIGFFGVMIIILEPLFHAGTFDSSLVGNIYLVLSTIASIAYMLLAKQLAGKHRIATVLPWYFLIGAATFFIPFVQEVHMYGFLPNIRFQGLFGLFFGAFCASLIGYSLVTWAMKYVKGSEVGIFTYIDPIASLLIAAPLLHEFPSSSFIFGAFLIFFGIYVAEGRLHWHPVHKLFGK